MRGALRLFMIGALIAFVGSSKSVAAQENGPETIVLAGAPRGDVTFEHAAHQQLTDCTTCHHEARPEKPLTSEHEACRDCHTNPATPPNTTRTRDAFHDASAKAGICVDCHVKAAVAGKTVPTECADCHKKGSQ
jgi:Class III cytochrome C family